MNTNKRLGKGVLTAMILPFVLFTTINAQHMGQNHNMDQNTMQHMSQQMMNMQQMMDSIEGMMERTSGMMDAMHDMGDHGSMGTMGGNGGNMGGSGGMMDMVHDMDNMAKNMQEFMGQMDAMMQNGEMINDPLINEYMGNMQEHMGTVMGGFESVITEMEKIQILNSK